MEPEIRHILERISSQNAEMFLSLGVAWYYYDYKFVESMLHYQPPASNLKQTKLLICRWWYDVTTKKTVR